MSFTPAAWADFRFHFDREVRERLILWPKVETIVVVDDALHWHDPELGRIAVPAGFRSDGASTPALARAIVALLGTPWEAALRSAVVHDYLHATQPCSWRTANRVFFRCLRHDQAGRAARVTYWLGVTAGGWVPWLRSRRALQG